MCCDIWRVIYRVCVCVCVRACTQLLSRIWLMTPQTIARQAPLFMGFLRKEYWSGFPFPSLGDLPNPGIEPMSPGSPSLQVNSLPLGHQGSPFMGVAKANWQACRTGTKLSYLPVSDLLLIVYWELLWKPESKTSALETVQEKERRSSGVGQMENMQPPGSRNHFRHLCKYVLHHHHHHSITSTQH